MAGPDRPPALLWRLCWDAGYGAWPEPSYRRRQARNFTKVEHAAAQLAIIRQLPPGHSIPISAALGRCAWEPIDLAELEGAEIIPSNEEWPLWSPEEEA